MESLESQSYLINGSKSLKAFFEVNGSKIFFYCTILVAIGALLGVSFITLSQESQSILLSYLLFGSIGTFCLINSDRNKMRLFHFVYAMSSLVAIYFFEYSMAVYGNSYLTGGTDDLNYDLMAKQVAENLSIFDYSGIEGIYATLGFNSVGYVYVVSLFVRLGEALGEYHTLIPRIFNCFCLASLSVLIYSVSRQVLQSQWARMWSALALGLMPSMVFYSSYVLRDTIVSLLIFSVIHLWVMNRKTWFSKTLPMFLFRVFLSLIGLIAIYQMRKTHALAIIGIAYLSYYLSLKKGSPAFKFHTSFMVLGFLGAMFFLSRNPDLIESIELINQANYYSGYRADLSEGGLSNLVFNSPQPVQSVLRLTYGLVTPIPLDWSGSEVIYVNLGTIAQIMLIPFLLIGIKMAYGQKGMAYLLAGFLVYYLGFALTTFQPRQLMQVAPFAVILTFMGLEQTQGKWRKYFKMMFMGLSSLMIIYVFLKFF